jgi:hypothetical protein
MGDHDHPVNWTTFLWTGLYAADQWDVPSLAMSLTIRLANWDDQSVGQGK